MSVQHADIANNIDAPASELAALGRIGLQMPGAPTVLRWNFDEKRQAGFAVTLNAIVNDSTFGVRGPARAKTNIYNPRRNR